MDKSNNFSNLFPNTQKSEQTDGSNNQNSLFPSGQPTAQSNSANLFAAPQNAQTNIFTPAQPNISTQNDTQGVNKPENAVPLTNNLPKTKKQPELVPLSQIRNAIADFSPTNIDIEFTNLLMRGLGVNLYEHVENSTDRSDSLTLTKILPYNALVLIYFYEVVDDLQFNEYIIDNLFRNVIKPMVEVISTLSSIIGKENTQIADLNQTNVKSKVSLDDLLLLMPYYHDTLKYTALFIRKAPIQFQQRFLGYLDSKFDNLRKAIRYEKAWVKKMKNVDWNVIDREVQARINSNFGNSSNLDGNLENLEGQIDILGNENEEIDTDSQAVTTLMNKMQKSLQSDTNSAYLVHLPIFYNFLRAYLQQIVSVSDKSDSNLDAERIESVFELLEPGIEDVICLLSSICHRASAMTASKDKNSSENNENARSNTFSNNKNTLPSSWKEKQNSDEDFNSQIQDVSDQDLQVSLSLILLLAEIQRITRRGSLPVDLITRVLNLPIPLSNSTDSIGTGPSHLKNHKMLRLALVSYLKYSYGHFSFLSRSVTVTIDTFELFKAILARAELLRSSINSYYTHSNPNGSDSEFSSMVCDDSVYRKMRDNLFDQLVKILPQASAAGQMTLYNVECGDLVDTALSYVESRTSSNSTTYTSTLNSLIYTLLVYFPDKSILPAVISVECGDHIHPELIVEMMVQYFNSKNRQIESNSSKSNITNAVHFIFLLKKVTSFPHSSYFNILSQIPLQTVKLILSRSVIEQIKMNPTLGTQFFGKFVSSSDSNQNFDNSTDKNLNDDSQSNYVLSFLVRHFSQLISINHPTVLDLAGSIAQSSFVDSMVSDFAKASSSMNRYRIEYIKCLKHIVFGYLVQHGDTSIQSADSANVIQSTETQESLIFLLSSLQIQLMPQIVRKELICLLKILYVSGQPKLINIAEVYREKLNSTELNVWWEYLIANVEKNKQKKPSSTFSSSKKIFDTASELNTKTSSLNKKIDKNIESSEDLTNILLEHVLNEETNNDLFLSMFRSSYRPCTDVQKCLLLQIVECDSEEIIKCILDELDEIVNHFDLNRNRKTKQEQKYSEVLIRAICALLLTVPEQFFGLIHQSGVLLNSEMEKTEIVEWNMLKESIRHI